MDKLTLADIPEFPNYISVAQAAKIFGVSKVSMYYRIYTLRAFKYVYRIGGDPTDAQGKKERPFLLLLASEVDAVKKAEDEARHALTPEQQLNQWNKRIKDWGREDGRFGHIYEVGRPVHALVAAYLDAHPDDPCPV